MNTLKAGVFILESTYLEDEEAKDREGILLKELLQLIKIDVSYRYIRTKKELKEMLKVFKESNYKYLHLACHGDCNGLGLTFDEVTFMELSTYLGKNLDQRRLFLSACSVTNDNLKENLSKSGLLSLVGCSEDVNFHDAAIFWAAFYRLIFKEDTIKNKAIEDTIKKLSNVFQVNITGYIKFKNKFNYRNFVETDTNTSNL